MDLGWRVRLSMTTGVTVLYLGFSTPIPSNFSFSISRVKAFTLCRKLSLDIYIHSRRNQRSAHLNHISYNSAILCLYYIFVFKLLLVYQKFKDFSDHFKVVFIVLLPVVILHILSS